MPKLSDLFGIRREAASLDRQNEIKGQKPEGDENLNDHVEIDFSASKPAQVNSHQTASSTDKPPEDDKKQANSKPQSKVSPFTNMHQKLNFIPHSQRDKLNAQFLVTLPGALKTIELVTMPSDPAE